MFTMNAPGDCAILFSKILPVEAGNNFEMVEQFNTIMSKYDLEGILDIGGQIYPDNKVTGRQTILLFETITNSQGETIGMSIREKAITLGLDDILNMKNLNDNIQNQQAAAVSIELYGFKMGIDKSYLKTLSTVRLIIEEILDSN